MNAIGICHTPTNQVRLTNVAYVRLQKKGKRFEIACYRNKVLNWRNKIETDIKEVLQIDTVFTNVSKGMLASSKDLIEAFGVSDQLVVCKEILDKGELQVSERERGALYESVYRDVASIVADKTVNPETSRPYTISMIQNAMKQIQYSVSVSKNSKSQALDVIRKLREIMPIVRANMLLRVVCFASESEVIRTELVALGAVIVVDSNITPDVKIEGDVTDQPHKSHPHQQQISLDLRVDPESFRRVEEIVAEKTAGAGRVEVIQLRVANSHSTTAAVAASTQSALNAIDEDDDETNLEEDLEVAKVAAVSKSAVKSKHHKNQILMTTVHDSDEEEEEEEEAIGIVRKSKKKSRAKKTISKPVASSPIVESNSDSDHSSDSDCDLLALAVAKSASLSVAEDENEDANETQSGSAANKKGKKSKRLEKEDQKESEKKAELLRERVAAQQKKHVFAAAQAAALATQTAAAAAATGPAQSCNTCGGAFYEVQDYRNHFKSEWHRHNLNCKMKGLPLVSSEETFMALIMVRALSRSK